MRKHLLVSIVGLSLILSGCIQRVAVKPLSLVAYNHVESATSTRGFKATETVRLKSIYGTIVEARGDEAILVKTTSGDEYELYPPLEVSFSGGYMTILSSYHPVVTVHHTEIDRVLVQEAGNRY